MRRVIAGLIEEAGREAVPPATVADAVGGLAATRVDLVVPDLNRRGESDRSVIDHVRSDPVRARTPILLLSGEFDAPDDRYARRFGVEAALPKPFEPDAFAASVSSLLAAVRPS